LEHSNEGNKLKGDWGGWETSKRKEFEVQRMFTFKHLGCWKETNNKKRKSYKTDRFKFLLNSGCFYIFGLSFYPIISFFCRLSAEKPCPIRLLNLLQNGRNKCNELGTGSGPFHLSTTKQYSAAVFIWFRYETYCYKTAVGSPQPFVHIAAKIHHHHHKQTTNKNNNTMTTNKLHNQQQQQRQHQHQHHHQQQQR